MPSTARYMEKYVYCISFTCSCADASSVVLETRIGEIARVSSNMNRAIRVQHVMRKRNVRIEYVQ